MKKRILIVLSVLLGLLSAAGCRKEEVIRTERITEFKKFGLESLLGTVAGGAFAISDDGELFLSENWEKVSRYAADGTLLAAYEDAKNVKALCLMGQKLFACTYEDQLLRILLEDGKTEVLVEEFPFADAQNLVAAGEYLYAHVIETQVGSSVKRISPATGTVEDVEIEEGVLRAVYGASDGKLYYCTEQKGSTLLYEYQENRKTSSLVCDVTDRLESYSTVQTFLLEQGIFLYTTMEQGMFAFSLTEERYAGIPTDGTVLFGRDIACAAGNIVYRTLTDGTGEDRLHTVYLEDIELTKKEKAQLEGTVTVRTNGGSGGLDIVKIQEISGLKTKLKTGSNTDAFLVELMAGNPDIDIYIVDLNTKFCREGLYEPLNSSKIIQKYQKMCFPYLAEAMEAENGDIWMLPVAVNMQSLWYVEENLERFGVGTERFRTMDSFLELSKEMKERLAGTGYYTHANSMFLGNLWDSQYIRAYGDIPNGVINFKTEAYRRFFDKMWSGWINYSQYPEHPYIERWSAEKSDGMLWEAAQYNAGKMLYNFNWAALMLRYAGLEGWRVLPAPKFSEEVSGGDTVSGVALVLNPHSRQKELALAYLETVAENPVNIYRSEYYTSFLFEDIDIYREAYDVELPAFQDLYQLFAGGAMYMYPDGYPDYYAIVDDYQNGRLTLDEALDRLQREVDMYLNE